MNKFKDFGFLSHELHMNIIEIRKDNNELFALSDDINKLLMITMSRIVNSPTSFNENDAIDICSRMLIRSTRLFQSIILLAEKGLSEEAITLTRILIENFFVLAALAKSPNQTIEKLDLIRLDQDKKIRLTTEKEKKINPSEMDLLQLKKELGKLHKFSPYDFAMLGDIKSYYVAYDFMSIFYSHSTPNSLQWYKEEFGNNQFLLKFEPNDKSSVKLTLNQSICAILSIIKVSSKIIDMEYLKKSLDIIDDKYLLFINELGKDI